MDRDRSNWDNWMTRLSKQESEELVKLGKILLNRKLIERVDRYNIARFALLNLHQVLKKEYLEIKKAKQQSQ
jgi:hypothetical protein